MCVCVCVCTAISKKSFHVLECEHCMLKSEPMPPCDGQQQGVLSGVHVDHRFTTPTMWCDDVDINQRFQGLMPVFKGEVQKERETGK